MSRDQEPVADSVGLPSHPDASALEEIRDRADSVRVRTHPGAPAIARVVGRGLKGVGGRVAVVDGCRTPFCKALTEMRNVSAVELGRVSLVGALDRCGLTGNDVDEVVIGNVASPPDAANIARVIALRAGVPCAAIAHSVNRNCGSGMESILSGWQAINEGRAGVVVAGGTESMSNVPLLYSRDATSCGCDWRDPERRPSGFER